MTFGIIGASGFIGQEVVREARKAGHEVIGYSRSDKVSNEVVREWRSSEGNIDLFGVDAVVCLSGYSIDRRWTQKNQNFFYSSRVGVTDRVVEAMARMPEGDRPSVFVSSSAVGIYGDGGDEVLTELSTPEVPADDYLAELCREWESSASQAESLNVRVVILRIGVVLGQGGAAFEKLMTVFKLGIGGKLGSGRQWMPWIHVNDLARGIIYSAETDGIVGPVNGTSPEPVQNADFTQMLATALKRPAFFAVPGFALKLVLGGFGGVLLRGQRAVPKVWLDSKFQFRFPTLRSALAKLLK